MKYDSQAGETEETVTDQTVNGGSIPTDERVEKEVTASDDETIAQDSDHDEADLEMPHEDKMQLNASADDDKMLSPKPEGDLISQLIHSSTEHNMNEANNPTHQSALIGVK